MSVPELRTVDFVISYWTNNVDYSKIPKVLIILIWKYSIIEICRFKVTHPEHYTYPNIIKLERKQKHDKVKFSATGYLHDRYDKSINTYQNIKDNGLFIYLKRNTIDFSFMLIIIYSVYF